MIALTQKLELLLVLTAALPVAILQALKHRVFPRLSLE
jgi:hypothetical protein